MLLGFATLCGTWIYLVVFVFGIQSSIRPPLATASVAERARPGARSSFLHHYALDFDIVSMADQPQGIWVWDPSEARLRVDRSWRAGANPGVLVDVVVDEGLIDQNLSSNLIQLVA